MEIDYFFVQEKVHADVAKTHHISKSKQSIDIFTKSLGMPQFTNLNNKLIYISNLNGVGHSG